MPIYTRTGDAGTTGLYGGKRISKADCQIETYGSIDELTSYIGLVVVKLKNNEESDLLIGIQKDLYKIMGFLSGAKTDLSSLENQVIFFEKTIDRIEKNLPKLNKFIIPRGDISAIFSHIARSICRRAEREITALSKKEKIEPSILKYINRLSDFFFTLARFINHQNNHKEINPKF